MTELDKYDTNGNGKIDADEMQLIELEDRFLCDLLGLSNAANILGDISPTYFVAVSALVASFFGAQAYQAKKGDK